jgi:hypothetical protein
LQTFYDKNFNSVRKANEGDNLIAEQRTKDNFFIEPSFERHESENLSSSSDDEIEEEKKE